MSVLFYIYTFPDIISVKYSSVHTTDVYSNCNHKKTNKKIFVTFSSTAPVIETHVYSECSTELMTTNKSAQFLFDVCC